MSFGGDQLLRSFDLIRVLPISEASIKRSNRIVFQYFGFSLKPILQVLALGLTPRFVDLLGARTHSTLHRLHDQRLLLFSTSLDVQFANPNQLEVIPSHTSMITQGG